MLRWLEKPIENIIMGSRLMILVAVVFGIISAFLMVLIASYNVIDALINTTHLLVNHANFDEHEEVVVMKIITAIDSYLIATVLLIFSIGLYELFISKITINEQSGPKILVIRDLDQLKENLAKVIIIVLIVTYFKFALELDYSRAMDLLFLSTGIFLIAMSVYFIRQNKDKS
jgi:uncharacterized membrane protein YqhA